MNKFVVQDTSLIVPKVSVLMPVFNAEKYLASAIESVINQSFTNFELICIDDGSIDNSLEILEKYAADDPRVKVFSNVANMGIGYTRRRLMDLATGKNAAIMDSDDIMFPDRLQKQVEFLDKNPEVVVVGGQCVTIGELGEATGVKRFPLYNSKIYQVMFSRMSVQQPTIMINKGLVPEDFPWYDNSVSPVEDLDNLFRLFNYGKFANLPDYLLYYRVYRESSSLKDPKKTFRLTRVVRSRAINIYGYKPTIGALIQDFFQGVIVALLPSELVFPVYALLRGMRGAMKRSAAFVADPKKISLNPSFVIK